MLLHHTLTLTLTPTLTPTPTPTLTLALAPNLTSALTPVPTPTQTPTPNPMPNPKVLLNALPTLCASPLLRDGHLQLLSVTLLSPDHPLDDFLATSYPLLSALGVPLTIYGDRHDKPLTYSELVSGERTLGKLWGAPWAERIAAPIAPPAAGAAGTEEMESGVARWLDVDVVDTTFMQAAAWFAHPYAHVHAHAHAHAPAHAHAHSGGAARGRSRGRSEPQTAARALCDQPAHGR